MSSHRFYVSIDVEGHVVEDHVMRDVVERALTYYFEEIGVDEIVSEERFGYMLDVAKAE